jgi:glycosyltransferase involved in cell wall biosynthesis
MRGGEKVLLSLARLFPDAPIFTLLHVKGSLSPELEGRTIHTSYLQHFPLVKTRYREYLPLFPSAVESLDLSGYDLVISSSHCVAKGAVVRKGALHLCYCHTPMRYVWDRYDDYFGPDRVPRALQPAMAWVASRLRSWDVRTAAGVTSFAANSAYVADRIRRYYGRPAEVIYPPVDCEFFTPGPESPGQYDLVVSALAPYKRLDLVLDAYRGTGRPVTFVGSGPEATRLRHKAPPEVTWLGPVDDRTLRELYRGCRAVIMPGVEDSGIVPLEAMACGRPAVVFAEGGGPESVRPGETGVLFAEPTPASLRQAIDSLGALSFNRDALRAQSENHARSVFESRFKDFVSRSLAVEGAALPW